MVMSITRRSLSLAFFKNSLLKENQYQSQTYHIKKNNKNQGHAVKGTSKLKIYLKAAWHCASVLGISKSLHMIGMCLQVDELQKLSTLCVCSGKHSVPAPCLVQGQHPQPCLSLKEEVIINQLWLQEMPFLIIYTWSVLMRGLTCLLTSWDMFASSEMRQCFKNALSSCWEL